MANGAYLKILEYQARLWELRDIGIILPCIKIFRCVFCNQHFTSFAIELKNKRGIELLFEFLLNPNSYLVQRFSGDPRQ